jgi:hypothetical protein
MKWLVVDMYPWMSWDSRVVFSKRTKTTVNHNEQQFLSSGKRKSPKDYCCGGADDTNKKDGKRGKNIASGKNAKPVPSFHGGRNYKRRTKMERVTEERKVERDEFISFLEKYEEPSEE